MVLSQLRMGVPFKGEAFERAERADAPKRGSDPRGFHVGFPAPLESKKVVYKTKEDAIHE